MAGTRPRSSCPSPEQESSTAKVLDLQMLLKWKTYLLMEAMAGYACSVHCKTNLGRFTLDKIKLILSAYKPSPSPSASCFGDLTGTSTPTPKYSQAFCSSPQHSTHGSSAHGKSPVTIVKGLPSGVEKM